MVFVTKHRHPVFTARHLERVKQIMRDVCMDFGCELREFNGETNHVHLLVNFPPKVAPSRLVNSLKGCPPAGCGRSSPTCAVTTGGRTGCGPGSYFAASVGGAPITVLRPYIEQQNRPD